MDISFRPKAGRFGVNPVAITSRPALGTLAAGTIAHTLGSYPKRCYIAGISICAKTFPTAATSVVGTLQKKPSGTAVSLTSGIDVNAKTAATAVGGTFLSTLTDAQRILNPGETIQLSLVTTGAVSVQPEEFLVTVELAVLE